MARGKAEDAGGLTPAKDDNAALCHFGPRTLPIFMCVDYKYYTITLHTSKAFSCFPTKNSLYFDFFRQNILSLPPFMPHILFQDEFSSAIGGSFLWRRHPSYRKRYGGKDYGEEDSGAQHLLR